MSQTAPNDAPHASEFLAERASEWLSVVARRRSRRAYLPEPADAALLGNLASLTAGWRPYPDARTVLVARPEIDVFTGVVGSYGKIVGAQHLLVFIGDERSTFADQHVGYTGEGAVLQATALGLATCWVGGFFSARRVGTLVDLAPGERVLAVSPLGYPRPTKSATETTMAAFAGAEHRRAVQQLAPGIEQGGWPAWAISAVETARLAPSAMNRQPWRFRFEHGALVLAKDKRLETPKVTKRLDIGIAMLHAELAALAHGVSGSWTDLDGMDVARFDPST